MLKVILFLFAFSFIYNGFSQQTPYLNNETYTFDEAVNAYKELAKKMPEYCTLDAVQSSDFGIEMPLFIIDKSGVFETPKNDTKTTLLINNAIHPGEPCGVDACIELAQTLLSNPALIPQNVRIGIIPIYNIGGAHNRNCCSRANQNGPKEYGFRGNAKNLDLNRDFIKADSKNTQAFYAIFHRLKPTVFVDTHTSNGADYQHTMTLITSQIDKMSDPLSKFVTTKLNPYLFEQMEAANYPMVPYVHSMGKTPDNGIFDYLETPRYSTGYTNLFNTISYVTEAHMLKPYKERVIATRVFLERLIAYMNLNTNTLLRVKKEAIDQNSKADKLALNWTLDTTHFQQINFKGYTAKYKPSKVTGNDRLFYDRAQPYEKKIPYYNHYTAVNRVDVPNFYIIPQAWDAVILQLLANQITVYQFKNDTTLNVEAYYITNYETVTSPYEGHYLHYNIEADKVKRTTSYKAGDYVVPVKNENIRFIVETLEPTAPDSYFAWNYFDAILQQKEWFSAYVFEDEAALMLENNPQLKTDFETKRKTDSTFANSDFAQLYYLYKQSTHYERTKNLYPVARFNQTLNPSSLMKLIE